MRAVLIINPVAGLDEANASKVAAIEKWLPSVRFSADVRHTSPEHGAGAIAAEAVEAGMDAVLVAGGDGTVSEVARALVHQPPTLGILPIGTFNNMARSVGVLGELSTAMEVIDAGHVRTIDVGLANEEHYFFEAAGAGLDAALFPVGEEIKSGRWSRIVDAVKLAVGYQPQRFILNFAQPLSEVLEKSSQRRMSTRALSRLSIRRNALFIVAANGPYYGSAFTVSASARMRDGQLTISIYRKFSKWELLRHFYAISRGGRKYSPKIETFTAREMEIQSARPVAVHIDGQPAGSTPLKVRAVPAALRVFAPADSDPQNPTVLAAALIKR